MAEETIDKMMECGEIDEKYYFNPEPEIIEGEVVPPITESHDYDYDNFPSVVDRNYSKHYYFRDDNIDEAHIVLKHSNGIYLIGLADTHVAVRKGIKSVNFDIGNFDRSKNKVSGKNKKGAMNLMPNSCLAIVTCEDDSTYRVSSAVQGKLVEINELLLKNPKLIGKDGDGHIGVVLPKLEKRNTQTASLVTEEEYRTKLQQKENEPKADEQQMES